MRQTARASPTTLVEQPPPTVDPAEVRGRAGAAATGWPTTTSPSSATASTTWSRSTARTALRAGAAAPAWASCATTRRCRPSFSRLLAERPGQGARAARARRHQGQLALDRAPAGLPGLRRGQELRRRGPGDGRAPVPRAVHLHGVHRERLRHPGPAAQGRRRPGPVGLRAGQPLRQGPAEHPGDLPARRAVPDRASTTCYETATAVMYLQERRRTRLFLRRDDYGRFMSCLVYLPRDRYTTAVRLRMEEILQRGVRRGDASTTPTRVSESVLARLHFVVRVPPGAAVPDVDADGSRAPAGRRDPVLGRGLRRGAARRPVGEEARRRLVGLYGQAFPEAYKEDFSPRVGGRRPAPHRGARGPGCVAAQPVRGAGGRGLASGGSRSTRPARRCR